MLRAFSIPSSIFDVLVSSPAKISQRSLTIHINLLVIENIPSHIITSRVYSAEINTIPIFRRLLYQSKPIMILLSNKSEMKLHWIVTMIVYVLKIFGLAPFSYRISTSSKNSGKSCILRSFRSSKIGMVYNILFFLLYQFITANELPSTCSNFFNDTLKSQIYTVSLIFECLTTNLVIIFFTIRQKEAISVMNKLLEIDRLLTGTENNSPYNKTMFAFLVSHIIFYASLCAIIFIQIAFDSKRFSSGSFEIINHFVIYFFILEYSIVLGLLIIELGRSNNNLLKLEEQPHNLSPERFFDVFNSSTKSQLHNLKLFITIRTALYEVSRDVAEFFSLPIILSVTYCFYSFIIRIHQFLKTLDLTNRYPASYVSSLTGILIFVYPTVLLTLNVSKAANEAKRTRRIVKKLSVTVNRRDIKAELQEFLLQLLHEDLTYTAYGIFRLDATMLLSILGSSVTYIIILFASDS